MMIIFLRAEENIRGEKKTNGDANQVDEKDNRRTRIFFSINPLMSIDVYLPHLWYAPVCWEDNSKQLK